MFKKSLLVLISSIVLNGCLGSHYYILSTPSSPEQTYAYRSMSIGVEKVNLPKYLFKREIAVAKSNSEVSFLADGTWAEDLDAGLTLRLIGFLQKKFNQPNVHAYPWGMETQPTKKVLVQISRFIAQGEQVYLDAMWQVEDMHTHRTKSRLFSTTVPLKEGSTTVIVKAMDSAFSKLEASVAEGIRAK